MAVNEALPLVASVHGRPAELFITSAPLALHETPDGSAHDGHWSVLWEEKKLANFIDVDTLPEKLACR